MVGSRAVDFGGCALTPHEREDVELVDGLGRVVGRTDPRPQARHRDSSAVRTVHVIEDECAACGVGRDVVLSVHHVLFGSDGRDDDPRNFLLVCGDGVTRCHGAFHAADPITRRRLGVAIAKRPEKIEYVIERLGYEQGLDYLRRRYLMTDEDFATLPRPA